MAQEQENAKTAQAGAVLAEPSAAMDGQALAEGIEALQAQALDGSEVSKQLEDLTGVVLSSAEVSTRSAEVAANISEEMRHVMVKVDDMGRRNVLHSRIMLVGLLMFRFNLYARHVFGWDALRPLVPWGGMAWILAWLALAMGLAQGFGRSNRQA